MAENPKVGLLHQAVPPVVISRTEMPAVLIPSNLWDWAVMSDHESLTFEWLGQLPAQIRLGSIILCNKIGRPQAAVA